MLDHLSKFFFIPLFKVLGLGDLQQHGGYRNQPRQAWYPGRTYCQHLPERNVGISPVNELITCVTYQHKSFKMHCQAPSSVSHNQNMSLSLLLLPFPAPISPFPYFYLRRPGPARPTQTCPRANKSGPSRLPADSVLSTLSTLTPKMSPWRATPHVLRRWGSPTGSKFLFATCGSTRTSALSARST